MAAKKKIGKGMWAVLEPRTLKSGGWIVSLGWDKETGKNPRRKFKLKEDADVFCLEEKARSKAHGAITAGADGVLLKRWMELDEKLKAARAGSLLEVGNRVLINQLAITRNGSAKECFDAFHAKMVESVHSGELSGTYLADLRNRCGRFLRWFGEDRPMVEASKELATQFFEKITDQSGVYRRTISAWAGWAVENGWLSLNPCTKERRKGTNRKGKRKRKSKGKGKAVILTPHETTRILAAALKSESWEVLSFLVLSLFAGTRPEEFRKRAKGFEPLDLTWEDWRGQNIAISDEMAKTGVGRLIPVQPVLQVWLKFLTQKKGKLAGHILPSGWVKLWNRWRKEHWLDADGIPLKWHADQLRHSFGCYHLSKFRSAGDTALAMGNSAGVVLDSYWKWDTPSSEAREYWGLTPEIVLKKSQPPLKRTGSSS